MGKHEPLPTMNHLIPPDRKVIAPLRDGIPVGTIRTRPAEKREIEYCQCETPRIQEGRLMCRFIESEGRSRWFKVCKVCLSPIDDAPSL